MHGRAFEIFLQRIVAHIGIMKSRISRTRPYFQRISAWNGDAYRRSCKAVFFMHGGIFILFLQRVVTYIGDHVKPYFPCTAVFLTYSCKE